MQPQRAMREPPVQVDGSRHDGDLGQRQGDERSDPDGL
jgi:hypothetical protein